MCLDDPKPFLILQKKDRHGVKLKILFIPVCDDDIKTAL